LLKPILLRVQYREPKSWKIKADQNASDAVSIAANPEMATMVAAATAAAVAAVAAAKIPQTIIEPFIFSFPMDEALTASRPCVPYFRGQKRAFIKLFMPLPS